MLQFAVIQAEELLTVTFLAVQDWKLLRASKARNKRAKGLAHRNMFDLLANAREIQFSGLAHAWKPLAIYLDRFGTIFYK